MNKVYVTILLLILAAELVFVGLTIDLCGKISDTEYSEAPSYNDGFKEGLEVGKLPIYVSPDIKEMVYSLCEEKNIDTKKPFYLSCPKCYYATYESKEKESYIIRGFLAAPEDSSLITLDNSGERVIESRLHCGGCKHLFGSDWWLVGFSVEPNEPNEVKE